MNFAILLWVKIFVNFFFLNLFIFVPDAKIDAVNFQRETALHLIVKAKEMLNRRQMMDILIQRGSDLEAKRDKGDTPLHIACQNGLEADIQYLIRWKLQKPILIDSIDQLSGRE